jgi:hypothetical protein
MKKLDDLFVDRAAIVERRARAGFAAVRLGKNDAGEPCLVYEPVVAWRVQYRDDGTLCDAIFAETKNGRWCYPRFVRDPDGNFLEWSAQSGYSAALPEAEVLEYFLDDERGSDSPEYEESKRRLHESMERRGLARRVGKDKWRLTEAGRRAVPPLPLGADDGANEKNDQ